MNADKYITSLQNPLIKRIIRLKEKKKGRDMNGEFVLEGIRELEMAMKGSYRIVALFFYAGIIALEEVEAMITGDVRIIEINREVYQRIAYRKKTEGIVALAVAKTHDLNHLRFINPEPLVLVAESPEKPGNTGALLRTADAAGIDAVIIADPRGDLYNPNIIRSSVGCLFTVPVGQGSTQEVIRFLKKQGIRIITASPGASRTHLETDFSKSCAIIVGTESDGLTGTWVDHADQQVKIPMLGEIDSMNVSVSAAILIFEAKRQRGG